MKFLLSFVTLAVFVVVSNSESIQSSSGSRANLSVGSLQPGDTVLQRRQLYLRARSNSIQHQDYTYNGYARTNITAVRATENGRTQNANAFITNGGIGRNSVTIRMQTARGKGFDYIIEIFGRL